MTDADTDNKDKNSFQSFYGKRFSLSGNEFVWQKEKRIEEQFKAGGNGHDNDEKEKEEGNAEGDEGVNQEQEPRQEEEEDERTPSEKLLDLATGANILLF